MVILSIINIKIHGESGLVRRTHSGSSLRAIEGNLEDRVPSFYSGAEMPGQWELLYRGEISDNGCELALGA